jgi:murein DD-endopeptidase MepM/ murein hydrolase activator NlpD
MMTFAQVNADSFEEEVENGYDIYVRNEEYSPVTFEFKLSLTNMSAEPSKTTTIVVPARTERLLAYKLRILPKTNRFGMGYEYTTNLGDHTLTGHDSDIVYELPFAVGTTELVSQGYKGRFSHQDALALDFDMPEGTAIHAARGGLVVKVEERFKEGCPQPRCQDFANEVVILHDDGTFGEYAHLRTNGALVDLGQTVVTGQLIGESGTTGFANGPHLHFSVFRQKMETREYIPTLFRVGGEDKPVVLKDKREYRRRE